MNILSHHSDAILPFALEDRQLSLAIYSKDGMLTGIDFIPEQSTRAPRTALAEKVAWQREAYHDDPQHPFDLPLRIQGIKLLRRLWSALREIAAGATATYGQHAKDLRSEAQEWGSSVVEPCHRILRQSELGGDTGGERWRKIVFQTGPTKARSKARRCCL